MSYGTVTIRTSTTMQKGLWLKCELARKHRVLELHMRLLGDWSIFAVLFHHTASLKIALASQNSDQAKR